MAILLDILIGFYNRQLLQLPLRLGLLLRLLLGLGLLFSRGGKECGDFEIRRDHYNIRGG